MDSMHRDNAEENFRDLTGEQALEKIKELCDESRLCFFCTHGATGGSAGVRPMGFSRVDDNGVLWFISAKDSHKNREIAADPRVRLYVHGDHDADFLYLEGTAEILLDQAIIDDLWTPPMKVWFTEGKDDPRISVIKVNPQNGYYWDTKHDKTGYIIKSIASMIIGKTLDDSIQGKIDV